MSKSVDLLTRLKAQFESLHKANYSRHGISTMEIRNALVGVEHSLTDLAEAVRQDQRVGELRQRAYDRLELCPDHRDKANGTCIVCQAETRTKREVKQRVQALEAERGAFIRRIEFECEKTKALEAELTSLRGQTTHVTWDNEGRRLVNGMIAD